MLDKIQEEIDRLDVLYDPVKERMEMFDSVMYALVKYPQTPDYESHVEFSTLTWNSLFSLLVGDRSFIEKLYASQ